MGKSFALLLVLIFLIVPCIIMPLPVKAVSKTIVVPDDYPTIQAALDSASEGDTVFVKSGIYSENLTINKSLSLVGEDKETTIVVGEGTTALLVQHDNVNVTGFTFKRPSTMRWYYGVHLLNVKHCNVFGNIVESTFYGIWLFGASFNNVFENTLKGDYVGIYLGNSHYNNISKNNVTGCSGWGIGAGGSNSNIIIENYVASSASGIVLDGTGPNCDNLIAENVLTHLGYAGIEIGSMDSTLNRIVGNYITATGSPDSWDVAIRLGWDSNLVVGNRIIGNQAGIYIEASKNSTIRWNLIESNPEGGIRIHSFPDKEALNNVIYENNIINNSVTFSGLQESSKANIWDFNSRGNYWSAYKGADRNADGIGDSPFILDAENVDHRPLMTQVNVSINITEFLPSPPQFPSDTSSPFPWTNVAIIAAVGVVSISALVYFKKRHH